MTLTEFVNARLRESEDADMNWTPPSLGPLWLRIIAAGYADHPDYDESWRP